MIIWRPAGRRRGGFIVKTSLALLLATLAVLPAALAGSAGNPEILDASGDAPAPLDVTSAWFTTVGPTRAGADDRTVTLTIKLRDLGAAAPAADDNTDDTRYYYHITLTPSATGTPLTFVCFVSLADTSVAGVNAAGGELGAGTACGVPRDSFSRDLMKAVPKVDLLASTFSVTFSRPTLTESPNGVPMPPGSSLDGVVIRTSSGSLATTHTVLFQPGANRGVTLDTTAPAGYVI
jgi:hypothetical protein